MNGQLAFTITSHGGTFMIFIRFALLSCGMLTGFNLVSSAPDLEHVMAGWGLFGFASTFLIGSYNERPTVRKNATFAFAACVFPNVCVCVCVCV
jgi:NADH:ubiquinone oxidoreductase subunit 5 (subunit L)/multisubunit Na+/H+ antiporter MnhA subunit